MSELTTTILGVQERKLELQLSSGQITKEEYKSRLHVINSIRLGGERPESWISYRDFSAGERPYLSKVDIDAMTATFLEAEEIESE